MRDFEGLGEFYLGRIRDLGRGETTEDLLLYDSRDLTTHAVCVGMTGSGKTGLCLTLLEEAALDGIPVIAIDPKGDVGNLCLAFPELRPADFLPWIDSGEADREGVSPQEHAARTAEKWRKGLASWGQDGARIARFRDAADVAIYTPGSTSGIPLKVLRSLAAPPAQLAEDNDAFRARITATVSGLLALLGLDADPIRSREHILLSHLLDRSWREGKDLEIASLIQQIQTPPFEKVGVIDLESFYPARERFELSLSLNNLLASPGFAAWMEGEPLDVARLLWTPEAKPRISILSIAHLSEPERMFFVTLILNEVLAWVRSQPGTTSLRALVYMDEVFGYFPPTANPPSKTPMLTLLKQARAYGLGMVLATQNPVDLDYKGLSNAGTWFIGRLQTERDKARVLDGLEGASSEAGAAFDRGTMENTLGGLKSRQFLMNNVHEDAPVVFETRWAMSYLRGPLTKAQIQQMMAGRKSAVAEAAAPAPAKAPAPPASSGRPALPPDVPSFFLPWRGAAEAGKSLVYRPALLGTGRLHFVNAKSGVDQWEEFALLAPLDENAAGAPWESASPMEETDPELETEGLSDARFADLPGAAARPKSYAAWAKALAGHLYRTRSLTLFQCAALKQTSEPGESEADFRVRLGQLAREKRDLQVEKLRNSYGAKAERLRDEISSAEARVGREQSQYKQQKVQTAISFGATLLGALMGRKAVSATSVGRATTAMRGVGRSAREKEDIARAAGQVKDLTAKLEDLESQLQEEIGGIQEGAGPEGLEIEGIPIRPRKSDISVARVALVWTPWRVDSAGIAEQAF